MTREHASQGSECVLIVEDEPSLLRLYLRVLADAGFEVEGASDGATAAARIQQKTYAAIVSDISMPGMDGLRLLQTVRERDLDVPVILITGYPAVETAIHAVEYGALRYLVKPFEEDVLCDAVGKALRLHELARLKREAVAIIGRKGTQLGDRAGLEAALARSMQSLWMAYQPIISWSNKKVIAFEALLRSSEGAFPDPGAMLEAAMRLGRLEEVGRAIRARVALEIRPSEAESFFVNLHTHDLLDETLYSAVSPLSLLADRVVLEITERAALDAVPDVARRISRLRGMGFRIALDDMGAGYAGLTSFTQLEPDIVKFDMSLVRGVSDDPRKRKVIQSMAALFKELGVLVIAEGVETVAERNTLAEIGCDLLQGHLFARPAIPFPKVAW